MVLVMVIGSVWTPASAKKKQTEVYFRTGGIIVPISENWAKDLENNGTTLFYDIEDQDTVFIIGAKSAGENKGIDKIIKLLSKKSKKSIVLKALVASNLAPDTDFDSKNLKLQKDSSGKYMAILDFTLSEYKEAYYIVVRNIDDKFLAIYGVKNEDPGTLKKSMKKLILGYAKKMAADEMGMTLTMVKDLIVPYDSSWKIISDYEANDVLCQAGEDIFINIRADYIDADEDTKKVASLLKKEKNAKKLKNTLYELMSINKEAAAKVDLENAFQMISDGKGSYYVTIDIAYSYIALKVVDDTYMILVLGMDDSETPLTQDMKDSILKVVTDAIIG